MTMQRQLRIVLGIFVLLVVIEILNILSGRTLNHFGNYPRVLEGLRGIVLGPFLHGNLSHFSTNILTLCIFSFLLLQYGLKRYIKVSLFIVFMTGILVWLFGRSAMHIGASGVIYGYLGFLLLAGFLSGKFKLIVISLLLGFFYGGLVLGVLPSRPFVSWESHLFGFLSGLVAAKLWSKRT